MSAVRTARNVVKKDFMYRGIILLGTNLGDKCGNLEWARHELAKDCKIVMASAIYETPPWGYESIETYYNMALECTFISDPIDFMAICLMVEKKLGRQRTIEGYSDRIIDIDILAVEHFVSNSQELIVPHPRLHLRKFALIPLEELWPNWMHPVLNKSIASILQQCEDEVIPIQLCKQ